MNYFVIQGILNGEALYWDTRKWVPLDEAKPYKTRMIAEKRLREIITLDRHFDFKGRVNRQVTIEEVSITYSIICKPQVYIGGVAQNVI